MVFLPARVHPDDTITAQPPVVVGGEPEFLIEASSAYPALEERTLDARDRIWFAFRVFDPTTPLYHPRSHALGLKTWRDLIGYKLDGGISFRLLLSDFDPIVGDTLHENTWRAVAAFYTQKAASKAEWDMQICPALHSARTGHYVRMMLAPALYARIDAKRRTLNELPADERADTFQYMRGYHRYLRLAKSGRVQWKMKLTLPYIFPVTHHHKLAVFDDDAAMLGGLDVNERRYDTPSHDRPSVETWHDVSTMINGPAVGDVAAYIEGIWNSDYSAANQRMMLARAQCPRLFGVLDLPLTRLDPPATGNPGPGDTPMQIVRTVSRSKGKFGFHMKPVTVDHGIEDAYYALIDEAKTLLYIETQFFRHKPLAEAMARRARECDTLHVIILLPAAPEEVAFDDKNGLDSRYGERLQADCIEIVRAAFGHRALFVCPAQREHIEGSGRHIVAEAPLIYVHAKVAVADDSWGIIGSANLNGRSLKWDSELGMVWNSPSAGALRRRLIEDWVDADTAEVPIDRFHAELRRIVVENARKPAEERRGFLLPYMPDEADAMGVDIPLLPPELV